MYTRAANMFKIAKNWSGESKSWDLGGKWVILECQKSSCELLQWGMVSVST